MALRSRVASFLSPVLPAGLLAGLLGSCSGPGEDFTPSPVGGEGAVPGTLTVTVEGLDSDEGQLLFALFRTKVGFPNDNDLAAATKVVQLGGPTTITFDDVPPGPFAISVFHDADSDFELDRNWLGIPKETWGVSRDAEGWMGPPSFGKARLDLGPGEHLDVPIELGK